MLGPQLVSPLLKETDVDASDKDSFQKSTLLMAEASFLFSVFRNSQGKKCSVASCGHSPLSNMSTSMEIKPQRL